MQLNHKMIRETIKWVTFIVFAISVAKKLKSIMANGGVKPIKDPNEGISDPDGPQLVEDIYGSMKMRADSAG